MAQAILPGSPCPDGGEKIRFLRHHFEGRTHTLEEFDGLGVAEIQVGPGQSHITAAGINQRKFPENAAAQIKPVVVFPVGGHYQVVGCDNTGIDVHGAEDVVVHYIAVLPLYLLAEILDLRQPVTINRPRAPK